MSYPTAKLNKVAPIATTPGLGQKEENNSFGVIGIKFTNSRSRFSSQHSIPPDEQSLPQLLARQCKRQGRKCFKWRPSIQVVVPIASALSIIFVVVVAIVPMSVGWVSSLNHLSSTCKDNLLQELALYRKVVVEKGVNNITSQFTIPPTVADLLSWQVPISYYTGTMIVQQLENTKKVMSYVHPFEIEYSQFSAVVLAWNNSIGAHLLGDHLTYYSVHDSIISSNNTNMMVDPVTQEANGVQGTVITNYYMCKRPWWITGLKAVNGSWTTIYPSADPKEGNVIAYVQRVNRSPVPAMVQITCGLKFLSNYFASFNLTAHGVAFLTDDTPHLKIIAGTRGVTVRGASDTDVNATTSPDETVAAVANNWLSRNNNAHVEDHFELELEGKYYIDVSPISVKGGLLLWLFLVTPDKDFLGSVIEEQNNAVHNADVSLWSVLAAELTVGLITVAFSVVLSVALARSLRVVIRRLQQVSSGKFMTSSFSSSNLKSGLLSELHTLNHEIVLMQGALQSFSKYVPTQIVQYLCMNKLSPVVGVCGMECTVLFLDIADFTNKMDEYGVAVIVSVLGLLFESFSYIITSHRGIVDKYIGDAIMALWGCPEPVEDAEMHACSAVVEIFSELERINKLIKEKHGITMDIRIGFHTGSVQAGNIGSSYRLNYTVLGSTVNLASRMEPLNKEFGTKALLTTSTRDGASKDDAFAFRALGYTSVRGFKMPILVHEFVGRHGGLDDYKEELLKDYEPVDKALCNGEDIGVVADLMEQYLDLHPEDATVTKAKNRMVSRAEILPYSEQMSQSIAH